MQEKTTSGGAVTAPRGKSNYGPRIRGGKIKREYRLGPYRAALLGRVESASLIDYLYVLAVFKEHALEPCLVVTSEVNADCWNIGGGSHFLRVSYREVNSNMGASDDWANLEKFTSRALSIAAAELRVRESPQEVVIASSGRDSGKLIGRAV